MYVITKQRLNVFLKIGIALVAGLYGLYIIFAFTLIGIFTIFNKLANYPNETVSQVLYVSAFIIAFTAILSSHIINKNKWPLVEGNIVHSEVSLNSMDLLRLHHIKFTYRFNYKGKAYYKKVLSKISFATEVEAQKYLDRNTINMNATIPVYIFKYYPKWSTSNSRTNILYLFYLCIVVLTNIFLVFFGFIFRIAGTNDIISLIKTSSQQQGLEGLHTIFVAYLSNFKITDLLLPFLILFVLILFILRSLYLIIHSKIFFFNSTLDSNLFLDEIKYLRITEKHCDDCNTVNDLESIFCSNCGKKLH